MPLMRVTPDNAVETVREQVESLLEAIDDAGRTPALQSLREDASQLRSFLDADRLEVELLALEALHPQWTGVIAHWLDAEPEPIVRAIEEESVVELESNPNATVTLVRIRGSLQPTPGRSGVRSPPVLVVANGTEERPEKDVLDGIVRKISSRPLSLIVAPKGSDWAEGLAGLGNREHWVCKSIPLEDLSQLRLEENLERPPWPQAAPIARAWSVSGALASLQQAFSTALDSERRRLRAKRATVEQRSAQHESPPSSTKIVGEVRSYLQKKFESFQKGVETRLDELTAPHEGTLTREVDRIIRDFHEFEITKKQKNDVLSIPDDVEEELLITIRDTLGRACRSSLVDMRNLLRDATKGVEQLVEEKGGPPVAVHIDQLPQQRLETLLDRSIVLQRTYSGQITRRGPMDYFMAARRYQMLFFMVFSAFGLSFIRSYREFTIPIGIVLMAFGLLNVVNGAKKQRADAEAKEREKARDVLRSEAVKAMNAVQKGWEQLVSTYLSERQTLIVETVEQTVEAVSEKVRRAASQDKELLQQQMKNLDSAQRKIEGGIKRSDEAVDDLEELSTQIVEIFGSITSARAEDGTEGHSGSLGKPPTGISPKESPSLSTGDASAALEKLKRARSGGDDGIERGRRDQATDAAAQVEQLRGKAKAKAADAFAKLKDKRGSTSKSAPKSSSAGRSTEKRDRRKKGGKRIEKLKGRMAEKRPKSERGEPDDDRETGNDERSK